MASVTYDRVTKRFGADTVAVRDFSLEVRDGECLILVGPSGCGKSTSLRMLAGLEDISEGAIFIGDRMVNNVAPSERDIAMVFQNYALYPHMSVFDNIGFGLRMRKVPRAEIERKVNEVAGMLGLERCWTASRASFLAASVSAWRWVERSRDSRRCFSSTSRSPTWTPRCARRRVSTSAPAPRARDNVLLRHA